MSRAIWAIGAVDKRSFAVLRFSLEALHSAQIVRLTFKASRALHLSISEQPRIGVSQQFLSTLLIQFSEKDFPLRIKMTQH